MRNTPYKQHYLIELNKRHTTILNTQSPSVWFWHRPQKKANTLLTGRFQIEWQSLLHCLIGRGPKWPRPRHLYAWNSSNQTVILGQSFPRPFGLHFVAQYPCKMEEGWLQLTRHHFCWCSSLNTEPLLRGAWTAVPDRVFRRRCAAFERQPGR